MSKRQAKYTSFIFVFFLFILGFNQCSRLIPDEEYNENKQKVEKPKFDVNSLDNYPQLFEKYLSDNFSLRGHFLKFTGWFNYVVLKKSPKKDRLIVGSDNWLYSIDKELNQYLGVTNLPKKDLKILLNEFKYRKHILDSMGIKMYVVINPTKYSIYPEYLPGGLQNAIVDNSTSRFINYFKENSDINVIYSGKSFKEKKDDYQLFYKGDNHWNELGGYFASKEIISEIKKDFPRLPFYDLSSYTIDTVDYVGNLANMTGFSQSFTENRYNSKLTNDEATIYKGNKYPVIKGFPYHWAYQKHYTTNNDSLPNVFVVRDSFAKALIPFLKNSFNTSLFIFDSWRYAPNIDIIEKEKPDIVVYMMLESFITAERFQRKY